MKGEAELVETDFEPLPEEVLAKARALVKQYDAKCFWFWRPGAPLTRRGDLRLVIRHLREYGDRNAWVAAQELSKCL